MADNLHRGRWAAVWIIFFLTVLAGEVFGSAYWAGAMVWFAIFEGMAVRRKKTGDTLSEQFWSFLFESDDRNRIHWARVPLVLGVTAYLCLALVSGVFGLREALEVWRAGTLGGGLLAWLLLHFFLGGRKG